MPSAPKTPVSQAPRWALAVLIVPLGLATLATTGRLWSAQAPIPLPDLVEIAPGAFAYREPDDIWRNGQPSRAPLLLASFTAQLRIMRHQVTAADYRRCAAANACLAIDEDADPDRAVVKVSWRDAEAYAVWLSRSTGLAFRLPTDREWAYAAGSRLADALEPASLDGGDPGRRLLALYDKDADRGSGPRPGRDTTPDAGADAGLAKTPQPIGTFGANEHGLLDLAGNVWEWTDTCFVRTTLDAEGTVAANVVNCGIRLAEGRHRAFLPDFIRDARAGGCSVGTPPSAIGFRLVLDARR
ncbi:MAG TPA: SUMF1/EgtB/PvdO family nonheme iron enzyme [Hyphomicrobiaceae bacterium]|nr:SUMF1/EgtB/PvdO family nonheme iron enzyme [Hyphomicrobiaceae bacterium]